MKKIILGILLASSLSAFSGDKEYQGIIITDNTSVEDFVAEIKRFKNNGDYELETKLCATYKEGKSKDQLDHALENENLSLELEGVYGTHGDHQFEVLHNDIYIGSIAGIFRCKGE